MFTILVANPKGGAGKTTIATNLAAFLAGKRQRVVILDMDRQRSAARWLSRRPRGFPEVRGALPDTDTKVIREYAPQWLIVDAPAGLHGAALNDLVKSADAVLVPVSTSAFDFEATADFVAELATIKPIKEGRRALAVVGSKVDGRTVAASDLDAFLAPLSLDVLTHIRDSQLYVHAARDGLSIFDQPRSRAEEAWSDWPPIFEWLQSLVPAQKR
ncbi:MAG: ParA family protein [Betaproteobacteria bacterium]|nr:MAG: ParA family protein [Betaproteobacteria bacterium]TAG48276.1 MAG: ParA family protein [Betaproteobacteria bacterium]